MGRYYNCDSGREGKFMFAVQSSDDPGYLGMHEQDPAHITYYADRDDVEGITEKLDEQYDFLGVDKKDRWYRLPTEKKGLNDYKKWDEWEEKVLHDKVWKTVRDEDMPEEEKGRVHWASNKLGCSDIELGEGKCLALARIRLALNILTDIEEYGCCNLEAEL